MAFVNVNRGVQDPYYRYKMPRIYAKVEGKGNGIKTVIVNMPEVAKALARPPTYPTKYFGCELGAQTNFDLKNDRYIVNGEHDANKLQDILDGFIRKFVLCPACENPETTLVVRRNVIHSKCKACGHAFTIDQKHKIATFILKNPPPVEPTPETKERQEGGSPTEEFGLNGSNAEQNGKAASEENEDDDDWAPEPLSEQEKLSAQIGKLVIDNDLEKSIEERLDMLHQYFLKAKNEDNLGDGKHLLNEAERLDIKTKAALLLVDVLLTNDVLKELGTYRTLFLRFCARDKRAQRYLLGGIEQLIQKNPDLLSRAPHILKTLYDNDICEEEAILAWAAKPSSKYVKKDLSREIINKCEPFITWLKEAEEETESEDEDDVAVDFDERSHVIGTVVEKKAPATSNGIEKNTVIKTENGEEVDIENI
ncbi:Eukaryotic translation initiation factor 5 [Aphelenchoides besseyi]|nr:Eukaryotic translation initiation factor 5 [Aphelenchoides besseyi]KAI6237156.1 Eukaryotic translation initiation factor 5 [Aphelenchoides besseyi]